MRRNDVRLTIFRFGRRTGLVLFLLHANAIELAICFRGWRTSMWIAVYFPDAGRWTSKQFPFPSIFGNGSVFIQQRDAKRGRQTCGEVSFPTKTHLVRRRRARSTSGLHTLHDKYSARYVRIYILYNALRQTTHAYDIPLNMCAACVFLSRTRLGLGRRLLFGLVYKVSCRLQHLSFCTGVRNAWKQKTKTASRTCTVPWSFRSTRLRLRGQHVEYVWI